MSQTNFTEVWVRTGNQNPECICSMSRNRTQILEWIAVLLNGGGGGGYVRSARMTFECMALGELRGMHGIIPFTGPSLEHPSGKFKS